MNTAGCDFVVFPAGKTPLALFQGDGEPDKILEVEISLDESLLRAANKLPIGAVLITDGQGEIGPLTWHHLMLFRRFTDLLSKPLLVSVSPDITAGELQALWEAGVDGVVVEVEVGQSQVRFKELGQIIDKITFPSSRRREKTEPLLPHNGKETGTASIEEEEEQ
ncbi:hypothetical protein ACFLVQ_00020 [Chloroflexota bacterium]